MKRVRIPRGQKRQGDTAPSTAPYEVGYRKPPKHTQFRKGQSGNRGGRPKGRRNFKTIITDLLEEPVQIRQGGRMRKVNLIEALLRKIASDALQGNAKAMAAILGLIRYHEDNSDEPEPGSQEITALDRELITDFLERHRAGTSPARPANPDEKFKR